MEPLDVAYEKFCKIVDDDIPSYWESILTEADTRLKIIDKVFVEVLGWPHAEVHLEDAAAEGRIDYRFTVGTLNRLIVEAKKKGRELGIAEEYAGRSFKLNGSVFKTEAAQEGIGGMIECCG